MTNYTQLKQQLADKEAKTRAFLLAHNWCLIIDSHTEIPTIQAHSILNLKSEVPARICWDRVHGAKLVIENSVTKLPGIKSVLERIVLDSGDKKAMYILGLRSKQMHKDYTDELFACAEESMS